MWGGGVKVPWQNREGLNSSSAEFQLARGEGRRNISTLQGCTGHAHTKTQSDCSAHTSHEYSLALPHEHTAPQLYSLTRLSLSLRLEDASPRAAERSRLSSALVRPQKASEDLGRSQKASMASSSSRKGPSVKAGLRALSYSNLDSVSCSVLMPAVSSFLPG